MKKTHLVIFKLGDQEFAVSSKSIKEIIRFKRPAKSWISFHCRDIFIPVHGKNIPVVNLAEFAGIHVSEEFGEAYEHFGLPALIVESQDGVIAAYVHEIVGFVEIDEQDIVAPQTNVDIEEMHVKGSCRIGHREIIVLQPQNLFGWVEQMKFGWAV